MISRRSVMAMVVASLVSLTPPAIAGTCSANVIEVRDNGVSAQFDIELAVTPTEQAKGLMYRESMPQFAGMLFIYERPRPVSFWMKNTLIPLDMLFIDSRGVVQRIHENAVPLSTASIPGGADIQYVLEINGGVSSMLGFGEGAEIRYLGVSQENAAWPCE